jgi:hypothetical protein
MSLLGELHAQRSSYSFGITRDRYRSDYGTAGAVAFLYNPRLSFHRRDQRFVYGLSSPLTAGRISSATPEKARVMLIEVPMMAELGFYPQGSNNANRNFAVFAGTGVARILRSNDVLKGSNYVNSFIAFRLSPFGQVLEARLNYGFNINRSARADKLSIGLAYVLR